MICDAVENLDQHRIIGLIVNPIAGMGGSVGLKGTDGEMYRKAVDLGAQPVAPDRTRELLSRVKRRDSIRLLVAAGEMGESYVREAGLAFSPVGSISKKTSRQDTRRIARAMLKKGAELLVFVGGDGTARDIYDAIGLAVPVVAVPSGVKVYSAVFAVSARAAAEMVDAFVDHVDLSEEEVLDIDEEAFRAGRLESKLYGSLLIPSLSTLVQGAKEASDLDEASTEAKNEIAEAIVGEMASGTLYLLGPGTTVKAISDQMGLLKTLLGVDAVLDKRLAAADLNEKRIIDLLQTHEKTKIIVTPLGGNGFIFGRGNKQFTPAVIRRVGKPNIIVVATRGKMRKLKVLRVDTGDYDLDRELSGYIDVTVGFRYTKIAKVIC